MRFEVYATQSWDGKDGFKINDVLRGSLSVFYLDRNEAEKVAAKLNCTRITKEQASIQTKDAKGKTITRNLITGKKEECQQ